MILTEDFTLTASIRTFALIVLLLTPSLWGADFRRSNWGDTAEDVVTSETATMHHQRADEIAYVDASIEGISGGVIYLLEDGRLVRGVYVSRSEYQGGEGVLADFELMKTHFADVLGSSGDETRRWLDESLRDQSDRLGEAISKGHVRLTHSWALEQTRVELILTGKTGGVLMRAVFQPAG